MRETAKAKAQITEIGLRLIAEKKADILREVSSGASLEKKDIRGNDLLSLLIRANLASDLPENARLGDQDLLAQVPTFLVAGVCLRCSPHGPVYANLSFFSSILSMRVSYWDRPSSYIELTQRLDNYSYQVSHVRRVAVTDRSSIPSTAVAWALYAMATERDVQQKLRDELLTVPTDSPTEAELDRLPYLDAVVRETLRLHAPVYGSEREAVRDDIVPLKTPYIGTDGVAHHELQCVLRPSC